MALGRYDSVTPASGLAMYGIEDDADTRSAPASSPTAPPYSLSATNSSRVFPSYTTRYQGNGTNSFAEPQPDRGGYLTDLVNAPLPTTNPIATQIDFTGGANAARQSGDRPAFLR